MTGTSFAIAYVLGVATVLVVQAYRAAKNKTGTPGQPVVTALTPIVGDLANWAEATASNGAHAALDAAIAAFTAKKQALPAAEAATSEAK